jgi:hypothetical protein
MIATQAEQETGTATDKLVTPGRQHFHPSAAKAWAFVATDGTLNTGYNLSSVRNSAGVYTLTFTTAMSAANYCIVATLQGSSATVEMLRPGTITTGSFRINTFDVTGAGSTTLIAVDKAFHVAVFGDI